MPFEKGVSGNPSGSSKRQARLREMAREVAAEYLEEAIGVHVQVMRDVQAPHSARVSAASAVIERAAGKASQPNTMAGDDDGNPVEFLHKIERLIVRPNTQD